MNAAKLQTVGIRKEYPGTTALSGLSVSFEGGKVHAVIGKNGSGKSTMVKILSGAVHPTAGQIVLDGRPVRLHSPKDSLAKGIATVYQELSLIPDMTVAENIWTGRLPKKAGGLVHWKRVYEEAEKLLQSMGSPIPVRALVRDLSLWQQQVVEIAKAMSYSPSVLLLDEPTSALAQHETEQLFRVIRELKRKDVAVIYISHRLQELANIADSVTVLRDGELIGIVPIERATPQVMIEMMFGETEMKRRPADLETNGENVLEVRGLTRAPYFHEISFTVRKGEILGIAGMLGSGRTELLRAIFGADPVDCGEVELDGSRAERPSPAAMKRLGLALTPESRKDEGLVLSLSTRENLCLASLETLSRRGLFSSWMEKQFAERQVERLHIKAPDLKLPVSSLSGGNQQKVVVGNWLNTEPKAILFDEPTRGIDVSAKQQIFQVMWDLNRKGVASVFVSSELEELLEVCQRILIMRQGRIVGEADPEMTRIDELYAMCMGGEAP